MENILDKIIKMSIWGKEEKNKKKNSADKNKDSQAPQDVRRYQISSHVYIVQTMRDGQIETIKILTPYE